jgi:hypothetical protein
MLAKELGLQDIWYQHEAPEKHWRVSQCIDHIYMSQEMMVCINTMEYLDCPMKICCCFSNLIWVCYSYNAFPDGNFNLWCADGFDHPSGNLAPLIEVLIS